MTTRTRTSRNHETRASTPVHEIYTDEWQEPFNLDTSRIPPRDGYVQRWIRTQIRGEDDVKNIISSQREGWEPRTLDSIPQGMLVPKTDFNEMQVVGMKSAILMERPEELRDRHRNYIQAKTDRQMVAVRANLMKGHRPGHGFERPVMKVSSQTIGGAPMIDDDDD